MLLTGLLSITDFSTYPRREREREEDRHKKEERERQKENERRVSERMRRIEGRGGGGNGKEKETVIYRAENVTGIAWHLLGVRKTEEKQTRRLSQVVPLKGGLLMSVAFFRPPNHRVPEGLVAASPPPPPPPALPQPLLPSPTAASCFSQRFRYFERLEQFPGATEPRLHRSSRLSRSPSLIPFLSP